MLGLFVLSFNMLLYKSFEQQKNIIVTIVEQQKADVQSNTDKFKSQQNQIDHLSKDLDEVHQQMKSQDDSLVEAKNELAAQKDALLQEVEKRQQIANESKSVQTSLVDIKAEADAIKQEMKGWQKDYISILAQLERKIDNSQDEMKSLENNLVALNIPELKKNMASLQDSLDKMAHPADNSMPETPPEASSAPEKKVEHLHLESP